MESANVELTEQVRELTETVAELNVHVTEMSRKSVQRPVPVSQGQLKEADKEMQEMRDYNAELLTRITQLENLALLFEQDVNHYKTCVQHEKELRNRAEQERDKYEGKYFDLISNLVDSKFHESQELHCGSDKPQEEESEAPQVTDDDASEKPQMPTSTQSTVPGFLRDYNDDKNREDQLEEITFNFEENPKEKRRIYEGPSRSVVDSNRRFMSHSTSVNSTSSPKMHEYYQYNRYAHDLKQSSSKVVTIKSSHPESRSKRRSRNLRKPPLRAMMRDQKSPQSEEYVQDCTLLKKPTRSRIKSYEAPTISSRISTELKEQERKIAKTTPAKERLSSFRAHYITAEDYY